VLSAIRALIYAKEVTFLKSIIADDGNCCYLCGCSRNLECHHIFGGANRIKSNRLGIVIPLCHACHNETPFGAHHNAQVMNRLKQIGQEKAMKKYGWTTDEFRVIFGKNYLDEKEKH
jgi:hypothetical protein